MTNAMVLAMAIFRDEPASRMSGIPNDAVAVRMDKI
jgi:hypothetical protein